MRKFTNCLVLAVAQVLLATQVWGQATCNIEPKKGKLSKAFYADRRHQTNYIRKVALAVLSVL
jgi:hypothetical protein